MLIIKNFFSNIGYYKVSCSASVPVRAIGGEFIPSDVPSNTLLLIPNEFGTVFKLGVQRLEILEELEIQYSQALAKPEQETISHNRLFYNRSTYVHSDSHHVGLSRFFKLSLQSAP